MIFEEGTDAAIFSGEGFSGWGFLYVFKGLVGAFVIVVDVLLCRFGLAGAAFDKFDLGVVWLEGGLDLHLLDIGGSVHVTE